MSPPGVPKAVEGQRILRPYAIILEPLPLQAELRDVDSVNHPRQNTLHYRIMEYAYVQSWRGAWWESHFGVDESYNALDERNVHAVGGGDSRPGCVVESSNNKSEGIGIN